VLLTLRLAEACLAMPTGDLRRGFIVFEIVHPEKHASAVSLLPICWTDVKSITTPQIIGSSLPPAIGEFSNVAVGRC
jgi:hypothetical protein